MEQEQTTLLKWMGKCIAKLKRMKKEDYIALALLGILLIIIALPAESKQGSSGFSWLFGGSTDMKSTGNQSAGSQSTGGQSAGGLSTGAESAEVQNTAGQGYRVEESNWNTYNNTCYDTNDYVAYLEEKLESVLQQIDGAGKVKVMVTVDSTGQQIPLQDLTDQSSVTSEADSAGGSRTTTEVQKSTETIFQEQNGEKSPFITTVKLPVVTGVVVIAQGAGNASVNKSIYGAVEVLFGLNEHRIRVIRMKS